MHGLTVYWPVLQAEQEVQVAESEATEKLNPLTQVTHVGLGLVHGAALYVPALHNLHGRHKVTFDVM